MPSHQAPPEARPLTVEIHDMVHGRGAPRRIRAHPARARPSRPTRPLRPAEVRLWALYQEDAPAIAHLYKEEVEALVRLPDGPDAAALHRLAGTVGLVGDDTLSKHLRIACRALEEGRRVDTRPLVARAQALADGLF